MTEPDDSRSGVELHFGEPPALPATLPPLPRDSVPSPVIQPVPPSVNQPVPPSVPAPVNQPVPPPARPPRPTINPPAPPLRTTQSLRKLPPPLPDRVLANRSGRLNIRPPPARTLPGSNHHNNNNNSHPANRNNSPPSHPSHAVTLTSSAAANNASSAVPPPSSSPSSSFSSPIVVVAPQPVAPATAAASTPVPPSFPQIRVHKVEAVPVVTDIVVYAYWVTLFAAEEDEAEPVRCLLELDLPLLKLIFTIVQARQKTITSHTLNACSIFNQNGGFDLVKVDSIVETGTVGSDQAQHVVQVKLPPPATKQYILFEDDASLRDFLKRWPKQSVLRGTMDLSKSTLPAELSKAAVAPPDLSKSTLTVPGGGLPVSCLKPDEEKGITSSHHAFELTLDMMLGIRTTVSRIEAQARTDLTMQDMLTTTRLKFPSKGSRYTPAHGASDFYFKDYHPEVFRRIRSIAGIDPGKYLMEVCGDFEFLEFQSNSKSGEFFFFTHNRHYMIKTISHQEACILSAMLPSYYIHLLNNPDSLLIHFYGMHKVRPANQAKPYYFLIMRSIFHTDLPIHAIYDLKGSSLGRAASAQDKASGNCVFKDNDFLEQKVCLQMPPEMSARLAAAVEKDVSILRDMNIMDYSLLIAIHYRPEHPKCHAGQRSISLNQISSVRLTDPEADSDEYEQHVSHQVRPGDLGFASLDTTAIMLPPLSLEDVDEPDPQELLPKVPLTPLQRAHSALLIQDELANKKPEPAIVRKVIQKTSEEDKKKAKKSPKNILVTPASDHTVIHSPWRQQHGGCPGKGFYGDHEVYFLGIIDILVEYGMKKKLETKLKSIKHDKAAISAVDPHFYSTRFNNFIKSHVVELGPPPDQ